MIPNRLRKFGFRHISSKKQTAARNRRQDKRRYRDMLNKIRPADFEDTQPEELQEFADWQLGLEMEDIYHSFNIFEDE